jgi:hypothetical protein
MAEGEGCFNQGSGSLSELGRLNASLSRYSIRIRIRSGCKVMGGVSRQGQRAGAGEGKQVSGKAEGRGGRGEGEGRPSRSRGATPPVLTVIMATLSQMVCQIARMLESTLCPV